MRRAEKNNQNSCCIHVARGYVERMTPEYAIALAAHTAASKTFNAVTLAYRARTIGDAEFIAARKAFDAATEIYDAAFAAEAAIDEVAEVEAADDSQLALF